MGRSRYRMSVVAVFGALFAVALMLPAVAAAAPEYSLSVELQGSGEGGLGCSVNSGPIEECADEYEEGTQLTLIAEPELGSEFASWGGECDTTAGNECDVEMDANKAIDVVFDLEEFEVTVETTGGGVGVVECQVDGGPYELCPESEEYPYETELTLYAEAEFGSEFSSWSGDCSGIEIECVLSVEEPLAITADFEPEPPFELTIETGGTGTGTVECEVEGGPAEECEAEYEEGTELTLVAEPDLGSEFTEWTGECDSTFGNECEVEMNADKTVEAIFDLEPIEEASLSIKFAGTGTGTVQCKVEGGPAETCKSEYPLGTGLALVAVANTGSSFAGFSAGSGSASGCSATPCAFTLEADSAVTAAFNIQSEGGGGGGGGGGGTVAGVAKAAGTATVKSGKAALKLRCSGGPCKGSLKLTAKVKQGTTTKSVVVGKLSFSIADGSSKTFKVKLSGAAKKVLAKGKTLKAKVTGSGVANSVVKLKAAKKS